MSNNPDDENSLYYNSEFARGVTKIKFTLQKLFINTSYLIFCGKGVHLCRLRRNGDVDQHFSTVGAASQGPSPSSHPPLSFRSKNTNNTEKPIQRINGANVSCFLSSLPLLLPPATEAVLGSYLSSLYS
jgi:hypothetical protein